VATGFGLASRSVLKLTPQHLSGAPTELCTTTHAPAGIGTSSTRDKSLQLLRRPHSSTIPGARRAAAPTGDPLFFTELRQRSKLPIPLDTVISASLHSTLDRMCACRICFRTAARCPTKSPIQQNVPAYGWGDEVTFHEHLWMSDAWCRSFCSFLGCCAPSVFHLQEPPSRSFSTDGDENTVTLWNATKIARLIFFSP